nr:M56 family metallopeptidase [uncultured Lachnoclostridium sp.]
MMLSNVFLGVLEVSILSGILIGIMLIVNRVLGNRYSLRWIQALWLLLAIRLLLPMNAIDITVPTQAKALNTIVKSVEENQKVVSSRVSKQGSIHKNSAVQKRIDVNTNENFDVQVSEKMSALFTIIRYGLIGISSIWVLGIILQFSRYSISYIIFMKKLNQDNVRIGDSTWYESLRNMNQKNSRIAIYTNKKVSSPFSVGVLKKRIILPTISYTEDELEAILCHEYTHLCNHDILFKMLLCIIKTVHWFNPFIYKMERAVNHNMELICDEAVIRNRKLEYRQMYGRTILNTLKEMSEGPVNCCATYFNDFGGSEGEKKQMKERFQNIIKPVQKKKKPIIIALLCVVALTSSVITLSAVKEEKRPMVSSAKESNMDNVLTKEEKTVTFLVVGVDSNDKKIGRADSIVLLNWNPDNRMLSVRNLCRDMYVDVPGQEKNKLGYAYYAGGMDLLKKTVIQNLDVTVDYGMTVNYEGFEKIVNLLGGVTIDITKEEANYLNNTNYISQKKNRTIVAGENKLNGNQALGYARVRHIDTSTGQQNDFGRIERLQTLLRAVLSEMDSLKITDYRALFKEGFRNVDSEMTVLDGISHMESLLKANYTVTCKTIPVEGSYQPKRSSEGMSVLDWNAELNKRAVK